MAQMMVASIMITTGKIGGVGWGNVGQCGAIPSGNLT